MIGEVRELLQNTDDIDPESVIVHFVAFSGSSLDVRVICQVLLSDWREFSAKQEDVLLQIMGIVERLGIDFAFPSRSIYIESMPATDVANEAQSMPAAQTRADAESSPDAAPGADPEPPPAAPGSAES